MIVDDKFAAPFGRKPPTGSAICGVEVVGGTTPHSFLRR